MRFPALDNLLPPRRQPMPGTPPPLGNNPARLRSSVDVPPVTPGGSPLPLDPRNVRSDLDATDTGVPEAVPTERQESLVKMLDEFYEASSRAKQRVNERAFLSLAFYLGMHYRSWNSAEGYLQETRDPTRPGRQYLWSNLIRPNMTDLMASAFKADVRASVIPDSDEPNDTHAAQQANDNLHHYDGKFDRDAQSRRVGLLAATSTTALLFVGWDPTAEAEVPDVDEAAQSYQGTVKAPVGDVMERIYDWTKVFPDPLAVTWPECRKIMTVETRPLEEVKQQYGAVADTLKADQPAGQAGIVETRLNGLNLQDGRGQGQEGGKHVTVYQYFELPSKRYPDGLYLAKAGKTLLRDEPYPYEKRDCLPFVPMSYENGQGTLWGLNAVYDAIPMQRLYNRAVSAMMEEMRMGPKLLVPLLAGIPPDAFSERAWEQIPFQSGIGEPKLLDLKGNAEAWLNVAAFAREAVNDNMGVHGINNGLPPSGVTAGAAINYLLEAAASRLGPFLANIKSFHKQRAEWELSHVKQFVKEPRSILVQPPQAAAGEEGADGPAPPPQRQVTAFDALAGGSCRVDVQASSALPQSPSAKNDQLLGMFKEGVFGQPGSPEAAALLLTEMEGYGDEVAARVKRQLAKAAASQPDPEAAKAQMQQEQHDHEIEQQGLEIQGKVALAKQLGQVEVAKMAAERHLPPSVSLSGKMDGQAVLDAEREAGLDGKIDPLPAPVKPTTAKPKKN